LYNEKLTPYSYDLQTELRAMSDELIGVLTEVFKIRLTDLIHPGQA